MTHRPKGEENHRPAGHAGDDKEVPAAARQHGGQRSACQRYGRQRVQLQHLLRHLC